MPTTSPRSSALKHASKVPATVRIPRGSSLTRLMGITPQRVSSHFRGRNRKSCTVATKLTRRGTNAPITNESVSELGWLDVNNTGPVAGTRSAWNRSIRRK